MVDLVTDWWCQTPPVLVVLSGLPGVGKSTIAGELARRLGACVVSVDQIEDAILRSGIPQSFETGLAAYRVGATVAEEQLRTGLDVIVDAANYVEAGRALWRGAAASTGTPIAAVDVVCSDPGEHRRRLEERRRGLDAFPEPSWADVERRAADAEPWTGPHLVVDATQPVDASVRAIVDHLEALGHEVPAEG